MSLFNRLFKNFIDSTDDVECDIDHILENIRDEKSEASNPLPVDENAQVRQQVLEDMERRAEDPMDAFLRRSRERRQAANMMLRREEEARLSDELNSFNPLIPGPTNAPHSWDQIENLVERTSPAFPGYPYDRSGSHREESERILARAQAMMRTADATLFHGITMSEPLTHEMIRHEILGIQDAIRPNTSIEMPAIMTSGNEDYMQLESQLQDFALLVQRLLHAESPADFSIQKALVEESLLTILPEHNKSSETPDESSTRRKLDLELD